MTHYSRRELCIANEQGVIEDGFYNWVEAQRRLKEIGDGEITFRDLYDEDGVWIEQDTEAEDELEQSSEAFEDEDEQ